MNANRSPEPKTVLTPTEARQGSGRLMNLRVLVISLVLLGILGLALTTAFVPEEKGQVEKTATETVAPSPPATQPAPQATPPPAAPPAQAPASPPGVGGTTPQSPSGSTANP